MAENVVQQAREPASDWGRIPFPVLDALKRMQEKNTDGPTTIVKLARLVNTHWSQWANGAIVFISPQKPCEEDPQWQQMANVICTKFTAIQGLNLQKCGGNVANCWEALKGLHHLAHLDLGDSVLVDQDLACIAEFTALRYLDISCRWQIDTINEAVEPLKGLTALEHLNLTGRETVSDASLAIVGRMTGLHYLSLCNCLRVTDTGMEHLGKLTSLTHLDISAEDTLFDFFVSSITDKGLEHLDRLTSLQFLNLRGCHLVSSKGLEHVARLVALTDLSIRNCNRITDVGMATIAQLSSLTSLNLDGCTDITDEGLQHIREMDSLVHLDLYGCGKVSDAGLECVGRLSMLESLCLCECDRITDDGLIHVGNLVCLSSLNLSGLRQITDNGLSHLSSLTKLQEVFLTECDGIPFEMRGSFLKLRYGGPTTPSAG
ncbi:unnamed protein product [Ostreobium quekettii]|uniref:Disease resistance R13L4/SHOC-2-like LRR domain-containing protein n=1 Tax=Ostreobium quekettii TaxID=121088 RepID=A0A8S1IUT6_9CHLO|nr:unnamed protein product [Ostreobium quekettii]